MDSKGKALEKAKKRHFEILRKNNAVTDCKNGELSLNAMRCLDVILHVYQSSQKTKNHIDIVYLRKKLGFQNNNDYVERIKHCLMELKLPFEVRDFNDKFGKKVEWGITSFLNDINLYKDTQHKVEINISENFLSYMVEKAGYTSINLEEIILFKTKYGYKLYEMYLRYYRIGIIQKTMTELNEKFGTKFDENQPSRMLDGINRGLKEIKKVMNIDIHCTFDKFEKKFTFIWEVEQISLENRCIIPKQRIDELADWVIEHSKTKIENQVSYRKKIKKLIKDNLLEDLESSYRGMLTYKYLMSKEVIDKLKQNSGVYKNF